MEYISREEVERAFKLKVKNPNKDYQRGMQDTIDCLVPEVIADIPSADVQPVVRCKDCKHRKERHYEESGEKPYIKYECKFTKYSMSDDGFCSFGAIMDGDAEC